MEEHKTKQQADGGFGRERAPKVKICGIRTLREADWLNTAGVDYAGFVFYEKSRHNVSMTDAVMIRRSLYPSVKSVAVTVSPTVEQLRRIEIGGFDIIQVHNELPLEVLRECRIPIWRAFNIGSCGYAGGMQAGEHGANGQTGSTQTGGHGANGQAGSTQTGECGANGQTGSTQTGEHGANGQAGSAQAGECGAAARTKRETEQAERERLEDARIEAYVLDGADFGGGRTFDWAAGGIAGELRELFREKKLVLAGGLTAENVTEGIRLFAPDIVDVSSGVECDYASGKDEEKIYQFVRKVREG